MPKPVKWLIVAVIGLVGMLSAVAGVCYAVAETRLSKRYEIQAATVAAPANESAVARGRHLAESVALCLGCHGDNLEGKLLFDEPPIATLHAPNITSGRGGIGRSYSEVDYVRAIRHGVNPEGRALMIMHSDAYHELSKADLSAVIAYVKSVPPVDKEVPKPTVTALGRVMVGLGLFDDPMPLLPAEVIDHAAKLREAPPPAGTPQYGKYLASIALCPMCHGADLRGGSPVEEGAPPGPNIAVYGSRPSRELVNTIRKGRTAVGKALDKKFMPWNVYAKMSDHEIEAIWMYLASLGG